MINSTASQPASKKKNVVNGQIGAQPKCMGLADEAGNEILTLSGLFFIIIFPL